MVQARLEIELRLLLVEGVLVGGDQFAPPLSDKINLCVEVITVHPILILAIALRELQLQQVVLRCLPVHEKHGILHAVAGGDAGS